MIVREVMTTTLVTVTPEDLLSHAANLLRQHQFHHLPVIKASRRAGMWRVGEHIQKAKPILEGLLTSQDIDIAAAVGSPVGAGEELSGAGPLVSARSELPQHRPWQERRVGEVMHRDIIQVAPTTSVAAAAQILVERGINCVPVVEYEQAEESKQSEESRAVLVGLLTRSDLLTALARSMGAFKPGMDLNILLPNGDLTPLATLLQLAAELHIPVYSVLAASLGEATPRQATIRLGTIHPTPLLLRLRKANINYTLADAALEGDAHG